MRKIPFSHRMGNVRKKSNGWGMNAMEKEQTRTGKKVFMGNHMIELEELVEEPRLIEVDPMEWQKHLPEQVRKKLKK